VTDQWFSPGTPVRYGQWNLSLFKIDLQYVYSDRAWKKLPGTLVFDFVLPVNENGYHKMNFCGLFFDNILQTMIKQKICIILSLIL
jgi:hypothetical protein